MFDAGIKAMAKWWIVAKITLSTTGWTAYSWKDSSSLSDTFHTRRENDSLRENQSQLELHSVAVSRK